MTKKRHHYIPKFYLNGFSDSDGYLWIYDKDTGKVFKQKPESTAYQKDYFSFINPSGEKDTETIENLIAALEGDSAKVVRKITNEEPLIEKDKVSFAHLVALMMLRSPNFRRNIEHATSETAKRINILLTSHKEGFKQTIERYEKDTGNKIGMPVEELREWMANPDKNYTIKTNPQFSLALALDLLKDFPRVFFNMKWAYIKATTDYKFLTGDNPLYYHDPTHDPNSFYGVGLINRNIEVTLPISKEICAFGSWKYREGYMRGNNQIVKHINRGTVIATFRFVFAQEESEILKGFVMKYKNSSPKLRVG